MLKRWSIENFKSFQDRTDIDLAPITLFAGANSSGKSTIIQSILLLKQTLQYAPINRAIALNGPLLKLGTFNDVKNTSSSSRQIGIGMELEVEDLTQLYRSSDQFNLWTYPYFFGQSTVRSLKAEFKWDVGDSSLRRAGGPTDTARELVQLQPRLFSVELESTAVRSDKEVHSYLALGQPSGTPRVGGAPDFPFDVRSIDLDTASELQQNKPDSQIAGATTQHFLPATVGVRYDAAKQRAGIIAALICGGMSFHSWEARELGKASLSAKTAKIIKERLLGSQLDVPELFPREETEVPVETLANLFRNARSRRTSATESTPALDLAELRQDIEHILLEDEKPKIVVQAANSRSFAEAAAYIHQYMVASVRYLGPLRDEPKPIYPLEALVTPTEVGYKGEHTAAVLDLHRDRRIRYLPSSFIANNTVNAQKKTSTLHDAVVDWLAYVGVASEVTTSDSGKFGHQLQVQTEGVSQFHDLTNVGVGVSQVLPIIVMALLAEPPSLLIFEQPELHLHPKVQARLADFFLSVALNGKQCLLETHSEYLIERFRRRIAEASGDSLVKTIKMYFTERSGGNTKCRAVQVSQYGAIADWPEDFFDQSQIETELILQAASLKRTAERRN